MGTVAKTMVGARAQLIVGSSIVGIFNNVSYSVSYDTQSIHILGKYPAAEITYTGMDPISVTASGFRVIDSSPYKVASVPRLQELLNAEDTSLAIFDRQTGRQIMTVVGVRATGYNSNGAARGLFDLTVNFLGLSLSDESDATAQDDVGSTSF